MTLLTICADAAVEIGLDPVSAVTANSDVNVRRLRRAAQSVCADLVARVDWSALRGQVAFTAVAGQEQAGVVPANTARIVAETFWDRTNERLIVGPVPAARWQSLIATGNDTAPRWFTLRGDAVAIYGPMAGGESMAFERITSAFCTSAGGTAQTAWVADSDICLLDEEMVTLGVIAQFLEMVGTASALSARVRFDERVLAESASDQPATPLLTSGDIFSGPRAWGGVPGNARPERWV
jgi:hypothetical protein